MLFSLWRRIDHAKLVVKRWWPVRIVEWSLNIEQQDFTAPTTPELIGYFIPTKKIYVQKALSVKDKQSKRRVIPSWLSFAQNRAMEIPFRENSKRGNRLLLGFSRGRTLKRTAGKSRCVVAHLFLYFHGQKGRWYLWIFLRTVRWQIGALGDSVCERKRERLGRRNMIAVKEQRLRGNSICISNSKIHPTARWQNWRVIDIWSRVLEKSGWKRNAYKGKLSERKGVDQACQRRSWYGLFKSWLCNQTHWTRCTVDAGFIRSSKTCPCFKQENMLSETRQWEKTMCSNSRISDWCL